MTQDQNQRSLVKSDLDKRSKITNVILVHDLRSYDLRSLPTLVLTDPPPYLKIAALLLRRYFSLFRSSNPVFLDIGVGNGTAGDPLIAVRVLTMSISQRWYCDEQGYIRSAKNDYALDLGLYDLQT